MRMDCITISDDTSATSKSSPHRSPSVVSLSTTSESNSSDRSSSARNGSGKHNHIILPQIINNNASILKNRVDLWVASTVPLEKSPTSSHSNSCESSDARSNSSYNNDFVTQRKYENLQKRNILIRHDFDKEDEVASIIRPQKSKRIYTNDNTLNGFNGNSNAARCLEPNIDSLIVENMEYEDPPETTQNTQKYNNNEVPLSPESQKKNELCSYLQLMNMNCPDQKMASKIQNRRSTRVKNLIIMSEKKELERRLNSEALEKEKESDKESTLLSVENQREIVLSKSPDTLNSNVEKENSEKNETEEENSLKVFNIQKIPRKMLEERSDFDDTIQSFIPIDQYNIESKKREKVKTKTQSKISQKNYKYTRKRKKYTNGNLNSLSDLPKLNSRFVHANEPKSQSQSNFRKRNNKLKSFPKHNPHLKKNKSQLKQDSLARNKVFRRIALRRSGRQNLRSRMSLSGVGIKNLILKDKKMKKHVKIKSRKKSVPDVQMNSSNCSSASSLMKSEQNNKLGKKTDDIAKKNSKKSVELRSETSESASVANILDLTPQPILNKKITKNDGVKEKSVTPNKRQNTEDISEGFENHGNEDGIEVSEVNSKDSMRVNDIAKVHEYAALVNEKNTNSPKEQTFSIIDLSHSKPSAALDTLNDHNYTLKTHGDKGYIMNVVLGTNEKSPVMETIENKTIGDGVCCKSPEMPSGCKEGEYCKEMLEEIIGIPWKTTPKRTSRNKDEDYSNSAKNDDLETCKGDNRNSATLQYDYKSYQGSLLLNSNSSSKMFNIRLPLLEPPTNIFDEGPYSPVEHHEEVLHSASKHLSTSDELVGRPRLITATVPPEIKSLHKSLMQGKRKMNLKNSDLYGESSNLAWDNDSSCEDRRSHSIRISPNKGIVMNAFYVDFNLVIVQEQVVSFWNQSALGNMLGSQNMWIPKGSVHRLLLDSNCVHKESADMVISLENSFAYVELWIKEHKSDKRERPVADVFATVYFWRHRQNMPDKKVLQLENINGKGGDVQYIVLRNSRNIVVSWIEIRDDMKKTVVHCYCLAADYQTVVDIRELDTVDHCVTSLHNIEDCTNMVVGFGEENVTLWNLEYGYVVATIEIKSTYLNPRCIWIKCDRGFLFILQHHQIERLLVLIAVNGISHSWKRLQHYRAPQGYDSLRGVCIDNNVLAAFYQRGVLCWNIQTGESVIEEMSSVTSYIPCDKHIVMLNSEQVQVQQFLSYFITSFDLQ